MHAAKAICSQVSHFLFKMASPKSLQKVGLSPTGSFGLQARDGAAGHICRNVAGNASVEMLLHAMDCTKLGKVGCICPSSAIANPKAVLHKASTGLSSRHPLKHVPSTSASLRCNATSSRRIHRGVDEEDDWPLGADKGESASWKVSSKVIKKGSPGRQRADVGAVERSSTANEDRIYFLGRLLTSILRHKATDLKLHVRNDGYVVVSDLLKLAIKTRAGIPLSVYTLEDVMKAVERDNKQRFSVLTENGVLLIRASQGHSIKTIESDKLLKPILSSDEIPGMRHTSEVLIYLDSKKALQDGMKLYMSDNGVILTEGFDGVVPPEYFAKIAKWKNGKLIPLPLSPRHDSV